MKKSLLDAIGCWTVNPDGLRNRVALVRQSTTFVGAITRRNVQPVFLLDDLLLLRRRIESLREMNESAIARCRQIIATKECEEPTPTTTSEADR